MGPNSGISREEHNQLREEFERKAREQKTDCEAALQLAVSKMEIAMGKLVTEDSFMPVRRTVYGLVGLMLTALILAICKAVLTGR